MTMLAIDPAYDRLLHEIQPKAIHTKKEHARLFHEIQRLMLKGEGNLTTAETEMLEVLATLVEDYEKKAYLRKNSKPAEMLAFLMQQNNLKAADLLPLPSSRVSEILSGKRKISRQQAIDLGKRFRVSPAVFLEL